LVGRYLERAEATLRLVRALAAPLRDPARDRQPRCIRLERIQRCW